MTDTSGPCCGNCRFSVPAMDRDGSINFKSRFCRRYPPVPMILPTVQGPGLQYLWPTLDAILSCGEWQGNAHTEAALPGENKPAVAPKADA